LRVRDRVLQERAEIAKRPEGGGDASVRDRWSTTTCLMLIGLVFVVSRVVYATVLNVGFDASPLSYYVQYLDARLLKVSRHSSSTTASHGSPVRSSFRA
jgi:hypothetical protein